MNSLEEKRKYELELIELDIRRKIMQDHNRMEKVANEKNVLLLN